MAFVSTGPPERPHPEPPWSTARRRPGREQLTRDRIAAAAMRIVDAEGLDALSMRRLADDLGTGPASLYAHVSGKDELLLLLLDRMAEGAPLPTPDPERWQEQLKEMARGMFRAYLSHRDLARAGLATIPTGPSVTRAMEAMLAVLSAGGLPPKVVAYASDLVAQYVTTAAYEASLWIARFETDQGRDYFERVRDYMLSLPKDEYPTLTAMVDELFAHNEDDFARFDFGLDVLVTGIAAIGERARQSSEVPGEA
jgi:AcrR family transcriptional regulator